MKMNYFRLATATLLTTVFMTGCSGDDPTWSYDTIENSATGVKSAYAILYSPDTNDGIGSYLNLVKNNNGNENVLICTGPGSGIGRDINALTKWVGLGEILGKEEINDADVVTARFDGGEPITYYLQQPRNGSGFCYVIDASDFISRIRNAKSLLLDIPLKKNGHKVYRYNTSGLRW